MNISLGNAFTLGSFAYQVDHVTMTSEIGNQSVSKRATEGASFVLIEFYVRNETSSTKTVDADDFFLIKDSRNRKFSPYTSANTILAMVYEDKDFILTELQPGLTKYMIVAYELPSDALAQNISVIIPGKVEINVPLAEIERQ